ncbi:SPOSA6832_01612, partial [Sporobolomyces salmonicolor]
MPPRAQQRPPQSLTPQPGAQGQSGSPIAQLNPQQLAALQEHIRQTRQQTGQEVTPQMITEWMVRNGIAPGAQQQQQQQQQMGMQASQQGTVPPTQQQVQGNLDAVLHHLYPPALASNPQAAMQHLQNVLFPPNQGHKQSPFLQQVMLLAQNGRLSPEQMAQLKAAVGARNGAQGHPPAQQAQPNVPYQQQQQHQMQAAQIAQQQQHPQAAPPNEQTATQAVQQLSQRVHHIEALLGRPDVNDEQRGKMQQELDAARAKLSQVVKMLLAAQAQNGQAAAQAAGAAGGSTGAGTAQAQVNLANLQEAQRQAMERKARELQAAQQAAQQAQQFGTGSPASYPGGLAPPPGSAALRQSPSLGAGGPQNSQMAIPSALNLPAPTPEAFPAARPTISGGLANSPSVATPAIIKHPGLGSSVLGGDGVDAFTAGMGAGKAEGIPNKEMRTDDSKGRTVSKRKIRELVEAVDPEERLSDEVEDLLLEICDEFIDSVTRFGCQLAKHRKSDRLEVKDLALHLERSYNIRVPGFAPEETRQSGARRVNLPPGHAARLAAVREGGRRR